MRRLALLAVGAACLLLYGLTVVLRFQRRVDQQTHTVTDGVAERVQRAVALLPAFEADRARVMAEPLFALPSRRARDAARMMEVFAGWRPTTHTSLAYVRALVRFRESRPNYQEPPALPTYLGDELEAHANDLWAYARELRVPRADNFRWLPDYAQWDIEDDSPRSYFESEDPFELALSEPEPDFAALVDWGRLLLVEGARNGNPREGLDRLKQLARLMLTSEHFKGERLAIRLLFDADRFAQQKKLPPPLPPETLAAARRYFEGLRGLIIPYLSDAQLRHIYDPGAPGVCAELSDSLPTLQAIRFGLERRHPDFYRWLDGVVASDACRLPLVQRRRVWRPFGERALLERWDQIESPPDEGWDDKLYFALGIRVPAIQANFGEAKAILPLEHFEKAYSN